LLLTFIFIIPELYCLYRQFDLHPEKVVFGKSNVSGIRFFFWDSQFGRFFNTGPIKGTGDKTFFLHTTLWAFLPWSVLLYVGVIQLIGRKIPMQKSHWIIYAGAIITFLLFSFSSFQLPHYILIIFPQCSILTAAFLIHSTTHKKAINGIIIYMSALIIILVCAFCALAFTSNFTGSTACIILLLCAGIFSLFLYRKKDIQNIVIKGMAFAGMLALFLNLYFYPNILQYQSGMIAAGWLNKNKLHKPVTMYKTYSYSLEFYTPGKVQRAGNEDKLRQYVNSGPILMYVMQKDIAALTDKNYKIDTLQAFDFFPVSRLNLKFLNYNTRMTSLNHLYVINIARK
jgi:hypothetical protein